MEITLYFENKVYFRCNIYINTAFFSSFKKCWNLTIFSIVSEAEMRNSLNREDTTENTQIWTRRSCIVDQTTLSLVVYRTYYSVKESLKILPSKLENVPSMETEMYLKLTKKLLNWWKPLLYLKLTTKLLIRWKPYCICN